jgi:oxygen-independent coproporphyrinogen III oxidase
MTSESETTRGWGIYVHIPTCRVRCPYCAFNVVQRDAMRSWDAFTDQLIAEYTMRKLRFPGDAATLYLGGGTPSLMPTPAVARLVDAFDLTADAEITIEANPEDVSTQWLTELVALGVNRISLGVQSTAADALRRLGRAHTTAHLRDAISAISKHPLRSWSVDLMFGLPNQDLAALGLDLERVLAFSPPHLSLYGLTIEPETAFEEAYQRERFDIVNTDGWRDMYDYLVAELSRHGLERYEVSNFAAPGHQSVHNSSYWQNQPYMGLGPGAHGYRFSGERWYNYRDLETYLKAKDPTEHLESPSPVQYATDWLLSAVRSVEGADLRLLEHRTGLRPTADILGQLHSAGLIQLQEHKIALTAAGFPIADAVTLQLIKSIATP